MRARRILQQLRTYECRNTTQVAADGSWPIVWERAQGTAVWDAEGRKYVDLTAAFGVAAAGHANRAVVQAGQRQMDVLSHAMGDVHPHEGKARLARELSRITFERWSSPGKRVTGKALYCNSGFEAVEAGLKTALLATGKPGVIAFQGAYHGLGYGALVMTHRPYFRTPFASQLGRFGHFVPFPQGQREEKSDRALLLEVETAIRRVLRRHKIGAILVEPVQGRGGIHVPPPGFLPLLRRLCDEHHVLLVLDEVFTGFGRTGRWFACEHTGTIPDVICLGKALTGGFPLSACVGRAEVMDAWPETHGEALHTSTFLGHPVGCAMALAQISEIQRLKLVEASARVGAWLQPALTSLSLPPGLKGETRGLGLMMGLELQQADGSPASGFAWEVIKGMLNHGFIMLPEGEAGNVLSFTPPLTITQRQLAAAVARLDKVMQQVSVSVS